MLQPFTEIIEARSRICQVIRCIVQMTKLVPNDRHETLSWLLVLPRPLLHIMSRSSLVATQFPKHRTA